MSQETGQDRRPEPNGFGELLDGLDAIVWEADSRTLALKYVSRHAEAILGYPRAQWLEEPDFWIRHLHPEDRDAAARECKELVEQGRDHRLEYRMIAADGRVVWLRDHVRVIPVAGQPPRLTGVMLDVTEQREAERALQASERRFRALTEHGSDVVCVLDAEGVAQYVSASAEGLMGYRLEELVGAPVFRLIHPDQQLALQDQFRQVLSEFGSTEAVQLRARHKDGSWRVLECLATNLLHDPDVRGVVINCRDVTDSMRSEQVLRHLSASAPCILWTADVVRSNGRLKWSLLVTNETAAQRLLPLDAPPGSYSQAWAESRVPEDCARMGEVSNDALEAGLPGYSQFFRCRNKHGQVRWLWEDAQVETLGPNRWRVMGVCTDMTEQRLTEERLRQSNDAFSALVQSSPIPILTLNPEGRLTLWNAAAERVFGYSAAEVLGKPLPFIPEADEPGYQQSMAAVMRGEVIVAGERVRRMKDGRLLTVSLDAAPLRDADGFVTGVIALLTDVTERKQTEAGLRYIAASAGCLLWHADVAEREDGGLAWKLQMTDEEAAQRLLPVERMPGESYADAWFRSRLLEDQIRTDEYGGANIRAGRSYSQEFRCRRTDGEIRWLSEMVQIETVAPGKWRAVGVCVDVTERKQAEEALRRTEEQLLQAQKMEAVGRLAGGVAHDFNNMLAVILGYTEILLLGADENGPARSGLEEIRRAADRAAGLTRQLLAFSRKQVLEPRLIDVNEVVLGTAKMLRRLIGEDIELATIPEAEHGRVKADPGQLEQVLLNLAVNARDAMPHGGKLTIRTRNAQAPGNPSPDALDLAAGEYVALSVADTGVGMDAATMQRIFEPFFTTKEQGKGTGLGLATVYGIVQQSGGTIRVRSEVDRGSAFDVYLPVAEGAPDAVEDAPEPAAPQGKGTILLVEDEPMVRGLVLNVLQLQGYTVLEAMTAEQAEQVSASHPGVIDLMLTDVVMPGVSGRVLSERLARRRPEMRVLFMSGYTDDAVVRHGVFAEGQGFIQKPFSPAALAARVREMLDAPGAGRK